MRKKAFTLVELIAVIVVLAIIGAIVVPVTNSIIKNGQKKALETQIEIIIDASRKWAVKNVDLLPEGDNTTSVDLSTLIKDGYIKKTETEGLINSVDDSVMDGCVIIKYSNEYNQYMYEYKEEC